MASVFMLSTVSLFAQDREITGSIETANGYAPGTTMDAEFVINFNSPDAEWADEVYITFPEGFEINSAPDITGGGNTLDFTEIDGQTVVWGPDGYLSSTNSPFEFTVNVTVPADASGEYDLAYEVLGDEWGAEPHSFAGNAVWAMTDILPVTNFQAMVDPASTEGNPLIALEWENHPEAEAGDIEKYYIYRSQDENTTLYDSTESMTFVDDDLIAGNTYFYQVSAGYTDDESVKSDVKEVTAVDSPAFAITPESHDFEEVGLLDGEVFYGAENQTFTVENDGIGTVTIEEAPYFFSGNEDDYSVVLEDGTTFPYDIEGPAGETGDNFTFEVAFNPETSGESSTLLVVRDNLDRVIRTFSLSGNAYDIPDYDLVENAFEIDQDWNVNFDYMVEEASFEGFYNDYDLAGTHDADVVYTTTVDKDSYLTFTDASGVADFAVFAEGDEIAEENNIYEEGETAIAPGTYVFVVSGTGDYEFNIHIEGQEPILSVDPEVMDLGEVPIGAWHPGGEFTIMNDGGQSLIINNVSTSDEEGVFDVEGHYEYPYEITTGEMNFRVFLDADEVGDYEGALLVEDDQTTHIYEIYGSAYQPVEGDVFETAFEPELTDGSFSHSSSVDMPMRNNYILDNEDVSDVVYRFAYPTDGILNVTLSDIGADFNGNMQLYHLEQNRALNPLNLEPVAEGEEIADFELWQGEYFIVLSGNPDEGDYTLNLDVEDMPAPEAVTLVSPEDGADDIGIEPELTWEAGAYTNNVEVYLGTQYPPQNSVTTLDGEVESYQPEALDPSQIYFWKVVAHNENGSTESETWAFTTILPPPLFVTGEVFDFTNVHLEWNNPLDGTVGWTEDFEEGELPEGWMTETNATGATAGWFITDNGGSSFFDIPPHTTYAVANDDAAGSGSDGSMDYLITPEQDFSQGNAATLIFDSYFTGEFGQLAFVEISTDGGETWEVVEEMEAQTSWVDGYEIDLTNYIGEDYSSVWIGFHADDDGAWASGWAVDNVSVEIENDTPWSREFLGYNIYQNGEQLNEETYMETEYDVLDLTSGTYEFGVSAVYNEGESEIITIEEITIDGRGTVEGQVTDVDSGDGIEDATVTFVANDTIIDNYSVNTDADGNYSVILPVIDGGYSATAAAMEYQDVTEQADVLAEETITVDFVMGETPLPVGNVVATPSDDDENVTVTWEAPSEYPTYEISYDDNTAENATAWNSVDFMNALKITPSGYPAVVKEAKVHIFDGSWPAGNIYTAMEVVILDDDGANGLPGTILGTVEVTPEEPNWVTVDLSDLNISISEGDFYVAHRQINAYPDCPPTAIDEDNPQGRSYAYDASTETWGTATYDSFMMRAVVSGPQGTETLGYEEEVVINSNNNSSAVSLNPSNVENGVYTEGVADYTTIEEAAMNSDDRAVANYEVYRFTEDNMDNMEAWTLLADDVPTTEYVDETWADADMGVYYFAVKAIYTITESDPMTSNMVAKDMLANTVVMVDLNTGDNPEGAVVEFENVENDTTYTATVPADGTVQFNNFWKGTYNLTVSKEDYNTYEEMEIVIDESAFIRNITLIETLAVPADLATSVDCKDVLVTWEGGTGTGGGTGDEFVEDFEGGIPADWTFVDQDGDGFNWDWSDEFVAHSGTGVMFSASFDNNAGALNPENWMITPEVQVGGNSQLSFWYVAQDSDWPGDYAEVKVSTTDTDPSSFTETAGSVTAGPEYEQEVIDLSDFAGETVYVAFHHTNSTDYFYINIDDVEMSNATRVNAHQGYLASEEQAQPVRTSEMSAEEAQNAIEGYDAPSNADRELMGYNVFRDGELLTDTPVSETEYLDEDLAGGTYEYKVSAVFSTGESDLAGPVEANVANIMAPENFNVEEQSINNVEMTWDMVDADGLVGYHVYRDGEMINDEVITNNIYIDYDIEEAGNYEYYVVAEYEGGCISEPSNTEIAEITVGVDDLENVTKVYPNPAKARVNIEVSNDIKSVRIMNYVGQAVYDKAVQGQDKVTVDTENYEAGSYIVQFVTNNGEVITKRFVVVK